MINQTDCETADLMPNSNDDPGSPIKAASRSIYLLGPQPTFASLKSSISELNCTQKVAVVTTGWQEDESNDEQLLSCLPEESINLNLFSRSEKLFESDADLIRRLRKRQDELRALKHSYRLRLDHQLQSIRELIELQTNDRFDLTPEIESAFDGLRRLDRQYIIRTTQICDAYDAQLDLPNRTNVAKNRNELSHILEDCEAIVISGGHVAIILNRLRIFGILEMTAAPIVAWSGGAMALADQIVLFHDHPPQGRGNPEVLRAGMGLFHEVLPLPGAAKRLDLSSQTRVRLLSNRFNSSACVELNDQSIFRRIKGHWSFRFCSRLKLDGRIEELS